MKVAVLHPGAMGATVAAALASAGHAVHWVGESRSATTRTRAAGFTELPDLAAAAHLDVIVSVCPPDAALALAQAVMAHGFTGTFIDANAISPATAREIAALVAPKAVFVDGGIIGPPAKSAGTTRLYLSGPTAELAAKWFTGSKLDAIAMSEEVGAASALKMAYAAWTKGSSALLLATVALAENEGVRDALVSEWQISQPDTVHRAEATARGVAPKAWRFAGEMEEIAATFVAAGLPGEFHRGAAELYRRLAAFKDRDAVTLAAVLAALAQSDES